jgi:hypothetical protein
VHVLAFAQPTLELLLQPPSASAGTDPMAVLMIILAAVWIFGGPWLRLCWWLGTQVRRYAPASGPNGS